MNKQAKQWRWMSLVLGATLTFAAAGCGGSSTSDGSASGNSATEDSTAEDSTAEDSTAADSTTEDTQEAAADSGGDGGGDAGTLVLGDETITLTTSRCYLQEQDAAGGGGKILFVGQGTGVNAAGDEVLLDVSRYDEDSQFTGDDITVNIGDFATGVSLQSAADLGTVQLDGETMRADGLTFKDWDNNNETPGSFELHC